MCFDRLAVTFQLCIVQGYKASCLLTYTLFVIYISNLYMKLFSKNVGYNSELHEMPVVTGVKNQVFFLILMDVD